MADPRALQVRCRVVSWQLVSLGTHACRTQVRALLQYRPLGQSTSVTHATQNPCASSHTNPPAEQSRDERHGVGRSTHRLSRHNCVSGQSRSASQSTQNPSRVEHTCPGHVRDEVHAVTARHSWRRQTRPLGQSVWALQSTQSPWSRSQTSPCEEQSRSELHSVATRASAVASRPVAPSALASLAGSSSTLGVHAASRLRSIKQIDSRIVTSPVRSNDRRYHAEESATERRRSSAGSPRPRLHRPRSIAARAFPRRGRRSR